MSNLEEIKHLLSLCDPTERNELFQQLRREFSIHPLEQALHAKAEIILEAIQRAGSLTLRMIRGVIAEAAFSRSQASQMMTGPTISNRLSNGSALGK
jgi:hypothetical protein